MTPRPVRSDDLEGGERIASDLLAEALAVGRCVNLSASGRCMVPVIRPGDRLEIEPGEPTEGAVALVRQGDGELVCHRALTVSEDGIWAVGDRASNLRRHSPSHVLGVVRRVEGPSAALRLDRFGMRHLGRIQAAVHRFRLGRADGVLGRMSATLLRLLAQVYRLAWFASVSTSRFKSSGTSPVPRPAASR